MKAVWTTVRYNKVANIIGHTMHVSPSWRCLYQRRPGTVGTEMICWSTVRETWGNILTGDGAAAPRYIEARLSKFALETVFNPKTTTWQLSYDGRNKEPVTLPVKFPLLLAAGCGGYRCRPFIQDPAT